MEILQEFESSSGNKKAYIVETSLGPRVMADTDDGQMVYAQRDEEGDVSLPIDSPKYLLTQVRKAYDALDEMRDERHDSESFSEWLKGQIKRKDPVGELAKQADKDDNWPHSATTYAEIADHLDAGSRRPQTVVQLANAWNEYLKSQRED